MRSLITILCGLLIVVAAFAMDADIAPQIGPKVTYQPLDDPWDLIAFGDINAITGDNQLLGVAYGFDQFYITGGYAAGDNQVYIFDQTMTTYTQFTQWSSAGWGWRDLCFDGTYFYGSDDFIVDAFDQFGVAVPAMNINGPVSPCRAIAYDDVTDTFWTASFASPIYNFNRAGGVIWTGASGLTAAYGMAWNEVCDQLYIFDQTGTPQTTIHEFDPVTHALTGFSYTVPLIGTSADQIAGGLSWGHGYDPAVPTYVGMTQGTPNDLCFVLEANIECTGTPVVLSAFTASVIPEGVALQWKTASELNSYGWYVQRDEVDVSPLIEGYGTTEEPHEYAYTDPVSAGTYTYRLKQIDIGGAVTLSNPLTVTVGAEVAEYRLAQNYPNPFNPSTSISFSLQNSGHVALSVFDVSGREVAALVNEFRPAGSYEEVFDASGLTSGVYIYKLTANDYTSMHKMVLMK